MGKKKRSVKFTHAGPFVVFSVSGGIGKNIMATAVIASIKKQHPTHKIVVVTAYPEVYLNNPKIYRVYKFGNTPYFMENYVHDDTLVMQSDPYHDDAFVHKKKHLIKSWCETYDVKCTTNQPEIYLTESEIDFAKQKFTRRKPLFVLQTTGGEANPKSLQYSWARDIHPSQAQKIVDKMSKTHHVMHIRKQEQTRLNNCETISASLRELFSLIAISDKRLFIDSFAFHCATALKLPSTVCFVGTKPEVYSNKMHTNITPKGKKKFIHGIDKYIEDTPWTGEKLYECPYNVENIFSVPKILTAIKKQPKNKKAALWEERKIKNQIKKTTREVSKPEENQGAIDQVLPEQEQPIIHDQTSLINNPKILAALSQNYLKKVNLDYAFSTTYGFHRGGWDYALRQLQYLNHPLGVKVDGLIENKFFWGEFLGDANNNPQPHNSPWIGFTHIVTDIPDCFEQGASPKEIFKTDLWKASVKNCRGLFCLSKYHKKLLEKELDKDIPIEVLTLPAQRPKILFDFDRFEKKKRIVQIGYWLRKLNSIYLLKSKKMKKAMLNSRLDDMIDEAMEKERKKLGIKITKKDVEIIDYLPDEEYDELLSENIVFLDLYDTASNNVIVECIVRNTPVLTNPHPATVEYLGKDYPLYFKDLKEAGKKANNIELIREAHEYLSKMDKRKFNEKYFLDSFANSKIYTSLPDTTKIKEQFIDEYFDKIYYINLDKRTDRKEELEEELEEANINTAVRAPGVEISEVEFEKLDKEHYENFRGLKMIEDKEKFEKKYIKASIGVRRAHLNCIKDAKKKGYKKILILEDDIIIDKRANSLFYRIINEIGDDWQLLYLGGDYWGGNVTFQLSSYALDSSLFDYIIENIEASGMEDDFFFVEHIQRKFKTLRATPMIMWQSKKDSDIPTEDIHIGKKRKKPKNTKTKNVKMNHVIAMPFWNESEVENFENLSKIWHLFDTKGVDYEFLLIARGDCDADTTKLEENLSKIKKVTKFVCPSEVLTKDHKNENSMNMFIDASEYILKNYKKDGGFFLWFEGDMIPTSKNWLKKIHQEWIESNVKLMGYQITYKRSGSRNLVQHMNGGGCYSKDLLDLITKESIIDGVVFDLNILGEIIKAGYDFKDSNLWDFRLDYKCKPMKMKKSFKRGKVIMHGPKDKNDYNRFLKMLKDKCDKK
jgi:hypothetical protein